MTNYLVKRLRDQSLDGSGKVSVDNDLMDAADCIERLEAALREIIENEYQFKMHWAADVARTALGEKTND